MSNEQKPRSLALQKLNTGKYFFERININTGIYLVKKSKSRLERHELQHLRLLFFTAGEPGVHGTLKKISGNTDTARACFKILIKLQHGNSYVFDVVMCLTQKSSKSNSLYSRQDLL